jgi:GTP-binding protein HflX
VLELGHADGRRRAWLHNAGVVLAEAQGDDTTVFTLRWTARQKAEFAAL